jgi:hypothetical protein
MKIKCSLECVIKWTYFFHTVRMIHIWWFLSSHVFIYVTVVLRVQCVCWHHKSGVTTFSAFLWNKLWVAISYEHTDIIQKKRFFLLEVSTFQETDKNLWLPIVGSLQIIINIVKEIKIWSTRFQSHLDTSTVVICSLSQSLTVARLGADCRPLCGLTANYIYRTS